MTRKRQNCQEIDTFSRRRFTSLLSPSLDPSRARLQFFMLRTRLLTTVIEEPEEKAVTAMFTDFVVEYDTDKSSDSLRPIGILHALAVGPPRCLFFPSASHFNVHIFFVFAIFSDQLQENWATEKLSLRLESTAKHKGLRRTINGSKLSKRWLAQLSENPLNGICERSSSAKEGFC